MIYADSAFFFCAESVVSFPHYSPCPAWRSSGSRVLCLANGQQDNCLMSGDFVAHTSVCQSQALDSDYQITSKQDMRVKVAGHPARSAARLRVENERTL